MIGRTHAARLGLVLAQPLLWLAPGCDSRTVWVSGVVTAAPDADAAVVAGATVRVRDWSTQVTDEGPTDAEGGFVLRATRGSALYLELEAAGYANTVLWGGTGLEDLTLDPGEVWMRGDTDALALEALFAGCPGAGEGGSTLEGELRAHVPGYDVVDGEWPLVAEGRVWATTEAGDEIPACYLDDEGLGWSEDAVVTGQTGRFALFGLPEGRVELHAEMGDAEEPTSSQDYVGWLPAQATAPLYPLYVPL